MTQWYYAEGRTPVGPLSKSELLELLHAGKLSGSTLVWHNHLDRWRPLEQFALEPVETLATTEEAPELPPVPESDWKSRTLPVGFCIQRGLALVRRHWFMASAMTALVSIFLYFGSAIPVIGLLISLLVQGPLAAGLYWYFLCLLRDDAAEPRDLLSGFGPSFQQLMLNGVVSSALVSLSFLPAIMVKGDPKIPWTDSPAGMVLLALGGLVTLYLGFVWIFALPLTLERGMHFWAAMQLSRQVVHRHAGRMLLLVLAAGLLGASGALLFGFGLILTMPIYFAVLMAAYEEFFGQPRGGEPPEEPR